MVTGSLPDRRHDMKHQFTVYYNISQTEETAKEVWEKGLRACQKIECDYTGFDQVFGRVICRWRDSEEEKEFSHELAFPTNFYMGTEMHWGAEEHHETHMKNTKTAEEIEEMAKKNGGNPLMGPEIG
jgi:hypothetical protein